MEMVDSAVFFPRVRRFVCFALADDVVGPNAKSVSWMAAQSSVLSATGSLFKLRDVGEAYEQNLSFLSLALSFLSSAPHFLANKIA